jgi:hypothetical protein
MHSVTSNAVAAQLYNLKIKPFSITIQSVTKGQEYTINFTDMDIGNVNVNAFALEFIGGSYAFDYEGCLYCRNINKEFLYKCGYTQPNLRIYGIVFYTD